MTPTEQLDLIQSRASERADNAGLFDHQREYRDTFHDLFCFLIGAGAITDEALTFALTMLADSDARIVAHRAGVAS